MHTIEDEIYPLPIIETSCGNTNLIGRMFIGNSHGLVVPALTTDTELAHLKAQLPQGVKLS
jgi:translation initiation factor 6